MNEEEELKKEVDLYERQNQEAYDKAAENEIKRKREAEAKYKQLPLFTRLNDAIEGKLDQFGQFVSEAAEDKPGITDDIVRGGLNTLQTIGNLPVIKQIGQAEEAIVGGVRNLAERQDLIDPRSFTYSTRIGLAFAGDKGIRKVVQTGKKVAAVAKAEQIMRAQNPALRNVLMQSIDSNRGMTQLGFFRKGDYGKSLLRTETPIANFTKRDGLAVFDEDTLLKADQIIDDLEAFHDKGIAGSIPKWTDKRPTSQYRGSRRLPYTKPDGSPGQIYFNWSASEKTYVARDVDKLIKATSKRAAWNVPSTGKAGAVRDIYGTSRAANAALNKKLLDLFDEDPALMQKIIGDTKQIVYVEHIHPGRSPYWNKTRAFGPGDPENLLVIEDSIFPKVKTAIEKQIYDTGKYKNVYVDMDEAGDLILKNATTDVEIGTIPGMTNQSQVKAGIYRALTGEDPLDLVVTNPELRPYLAKLDAFDSETFGRLEDAKPGKFAEKMQPRFEEISQEIERLEVRLAASKSGEGVVLNRQAERAMELQIKRLKREVQQLNVFDTAGEGTGLRIPRQKIKVKRPKRIKRRVDEGQIDSSVQIPIEYQGPKYGK
tara:strand:- start:136 stop:1929 length:1794 start_codon:yes stop_codon:yes gene_type:complete